MIKNARPGFRQAPKPTKAQEQRASILERVDSLEGAYRDLVDGSNSLFRKHAERLGMLEEAMSAVIEAVGIEHVQNILIAKKKRMQDERNEALRLLVQKAVEDGQAEVTDTIAEDSLIIGLEKNANGEVVNERAQVPFSQLLPQFKESLLGKQVGASVATTPVDDAGNEQAPGTFEVLEIYRILPPKEEAEIPAGVETE